MCKNMTTGFALPKFYIRKYNVQGCALNRIPAARMFSIKLFITT